MAKEEPEPDPKPIEWLKEKVNAIGAKKLLIAAVFASLLFLPLPTLQEVEMGNQTAYRLGRAEEPVALQALSFLPLGSSTDKVPLDEVGDSVVGYINSNMIETGEITLVSAEDKGGYYEFRTEYQGNMIPVYATVDGELLFLQPYDLTREPVQQESNMVQPTGRIIGNFLVSDEEVCTEDGKPIIYFFGSNSCPYCQWEHPVINNVTAKFSDYITYHDNMDNNEDMDVFSRYSSGGVPTIVLGCKYFRQGAGTSIGEENETLALKAIICKLTDRQPSDVCAEVQDLVDQL